MITVAFTPGSYTPGLAVHFSHAGSVVSDSFELSAEVGVSGFYHFDIVAEVGSISFNRTQHELVSEVGVSGFYAFDIVSTVGARILTPIDIAAEIGVSGFYAFDIVATVGVVSVDAVTHHDLVATIANTANVDLSATVASIRHIMLNSQIGIIETTHLTITAIVPMTHQVQVDLVAPVRLHQDSFKHLEMIAIVAMTDDLESIVIDIHQPETPVYGDY